MTVWCQVEECSKFLEQQLERLSCRNLFWMPTDVWIFGIQIVVAVMVVTAKQWNLRRYILGLLMPLNICVWLTVKKKQ